MEIAVCINRVPDTGSRVDVQDGAVNVSALNMVLNAYDEYAIEESVRLKERFSGVTVTAFSLGTKENYDILRKALAMGVDKACLIEGGNDDDSYVVAASLSRAIREYYSVLPDLVFCGRESSDFNRAQVPLMVAEMLGVAAISAVTFLEIRGSNVTVTRETEGGIEEYILQLPAVISAEKGLNVPRKTSIKAVMKARKEPIVHVDGHTDELPRIEYGEFSMVNRKRNCRFIDIVEDLVPALLEKGVV
ncbi:MAG: electron transfer flavoprotein subunit beta/FixA family protein [Chlorobium phaeobacteroides]|uniref:Electron transfer flavoprotein alpha/beta-subunit n=1 Tax=Chlorobium phaeobacteroides (strain BS1) TaxID=331678 RepID=B3ELR4_CHLPB|nr:electron transfer flavoprotein subunit beta/FixA family protein [Chlorobium phaeobacteroides]